jgi:hypothetical protein
MSHPYSTFIGPYAEWRVKRARKGARPLDQLSLDELPWYDSLVLSGGVFHLGGGDGVPIVKIDKVAYSVWRFMPNKKRPNRPPRQMHLDSGMLENDFEDWSWINPRAEMDWFTEAFAPELAVLAEYFGEQPTIGWGALSVN